MANPRYVLHAAASAMMQSMDVASSKTTLRLGTRGSMLARAQSQLIANALEARHSGLRVELVICKTTGDRIQDRPLHAAGGKGLFTKELEEALLNETVDFAVHSFKDVPVTMPLVDQAGLVIAAVPTREDVRDVLISPHARLISELPEGVRIGTGSLRRRCQILALRMDLRVEMIRGNIDTRLRKLQEGRFDAIILAMAGVKRGGLFDSSKMHPIPPEEVLPAAGQGALAIQCRKEDRSTHEVLAALNDPVSEKCVALERELVKELNGDCHSPIAALATIDRQTVHFCATVGARGGELPVIRAEASASISDPTAALKTVMRSLEDQGARNLLAGRHRP